MAITRSFGILATTALLASAFGVASYADELSQNYQQYNAAQVQLELSANKLTLEQVDRINAQHYQSVVSADGSIVVDPVRGLPALIAHKALYRYYTSQSDQSFTVDFGDGTSVVLGSDSYLPARDCFPPIKTPPGCLGSFNATHIYAAAGTYAATVKNASGTVVGSLKVYVP
jgi:hypothetical protein